MTGRGRGAALSFAAVAAALVAAAGSPAHAQVSPQATAVASHAQPALHNVLACRRDYYENVSGHCVHRPARSPGGATARCRDGTYSYSEHASGTCSHHGGVGRWIHHP